MNQRIARNTSLPCLLGMAMVLISASCSQKNLAATPDSTSTDKIAVPVAAVPPVEAPIPSESAIPVPATETKIPVPAPPSNPAPPPTSHNDELIIIKAGESAKLSSSTSLDFVRVVSDSRCPAGTQCIWAGEITIELKLHSGQDQQTFKLTDHSKTAAILGMQVELLSIDGANTASFRVKKI